MDNFSKHKRVLVTGFSPFTLRDLNYDVNASIEAVKLINKEDLERSLDITLHTAEVPVEYQYIDNTMPYVWKEFQPNLSIHVGVWDDVNVFKLEKVARKYTYHVEDNIGHKPHEGNNLYPGPEDIATDLPVDSICDIYNSEVNDWFIKADVSEDAGKYVCEYMYYTSLCLHSEGPRHSLFVHVPARQTYDEFAALAQGLERIIEICVDHIRNPREHIMKGGCCQIL